MCTYFLKSLKNPSVYKASLSTLKQDNSFYLVILYLSTTILTPQHIHRYCNIDKAQSRTVCKE